MSTHKLALAVLASCALLATHASGESHGSRVSADLPETLPVKGEPKPASPSVPEASGETEPGLEQDFGIGRPATEAEIAAIDIDIMPDGRGLPPGSGTYSQGEEVYADRCAVCHGENLEGIKELGAPQLIGGRGTLASEKPVKTVESYWPHASTLFDYVHRAMPMDEPGSLTSDEVYAVSAYILGKAGILDTETTLDAESFRAVKMPNADGFVPDPRADGL